MAVEERMPDIPSDNSEKRTRKWYYRHSEAILHDFAQHGLEGTRRKWGMRGNTLEKLLALWGHPPAGVAQLSLEIPATPLVTAKGHYPTQIQSAADHVLAALIERRLVSDNYLTIGLCIMEVLSPLLPPPPQEQAKPYRSPGLAP